MKVINVREMYVAGFEYLAPFIVALQSNELTVVEEAWYAYKTLDLYYKTKDIREAVETAIEEMVKEEGESLASLVEAEKLYKENMFVFTEIDQKGEKVSLLLKQKTVRLQLEGGWNPYSYKKQREQEKSTREESRKKAGSGSSGGSGRSWSTTGFSGKDLAIVEVNKVLRSLGMDIMPLSPSASEVKTFHTQLVRKLHPDISGKDTTRQMQEVNRLFDIIKG